MAMLRAAAASGTRRIAATAHLRSDFPDVRVGELAQRCQQLREAAARERLAIRIVCAAEVSLAWALEASNEELMLATYEQRGTDLLIETPTFNVAGLDRLLYELPAKRLRVTLAHPERNPEFQRDPSLLTPSLSTSARACSFS
jgi:protein-tyrosine phosphatase